MLERKLVGKRQYKYSNNFAEKCSTTLNQEKNSTTNTHTVMKVGTNALVLCVDKCIPSDKEGRQ